MDEVERLFGACFDFGSWRGWFGAQAQAIRAVSDGNRLAQQAFRRCLWIWPVKRAWVAAFALKAMGCFAAVLIATKPVKSCDRDVFWVFYLLPQTEQMQQARAASGLRFRAHGWI